MKGTAGRPLNTVGNSPLGRYRGAGDEPGKARLSPTQTAKRSK